jgi:competence ComEA-like helix-hairpin-helix protein
MKGKLQSLLMVALLLATALPALSADKSDKSDKDKSYKNKDAAAETKPLRDDRPAAAARGKVDINTADKAALEALPGVGPVIAQEIIDARPFKSVADLKNVKGIGDKRFEEILPHVTLSGATGRPAAGTTGSARSSARTREAEEAKARETGSTIPSSTSSTGTDKPAQRAAQPQKE